MGINRSDLILMALVSIPVEAVSFVLLLMNPIDVGYPPGTNPLWNITIWGLWVHAPALLLRADRLPQVALLPTLLVAGYIVIWAFLVALLVAWRATKKLISPL